MSRADVIAFLARRKDEPLPEVDGKTDRQLRQMCFAKYPIQNPNCINERFIRQRQRDAYFEKLKLLRDNKSE